MADARDQTPPFAELYAPFDPDFEADDCALISPRTAFFLWAAAQILQDDWGTLRDSTREFLLEDLPPIARRVADDQFLDGITECFARWEQRIATADVYATRAECTAEEFAFHKIVDEALFLVETASEDDEAWPEAKALTGGDDARAEVEDARTDLLEDHDVLLLFDPAWDGIEDSDVADKLNMANLHPRDWFEPFRP